MNQQPLDPSQTQPRSVGSIASQAARLLGSSEFPMGERAALRRLDPRNPATRIGAVCRLLIRCGCDVDALSRDDLLRWTLVLHTLALMSRPGFVPHGSDATGRAIAEARYSDARFTKLLTARGQAFRDQIPRLGRFLAAKGVQLDVRPLVRLVLTEGRDEDTAEEIRLRLARQYYAATARPQEAAEKAQQRGAA